SGWSRTSGPKGVRKSLECSPHAPREESGVAARRPFFLFLLFFGVRWPDTAFFRWPACPFERIRCRPGRVAGMKSRPKKESGVEPPHSKGRLNSYEFSYFG